MVADTTLYDALGLKPEASQSEIKRAYLKLARQYHPDKNTSEDAHEKLIQINKANDILSDPEKRKEYDAYGLEGPGASAFGGDVMDIFASMFGGAGGRRRQREPQASDFNLDIPIKISLKDAFLGCRKTVKFTRKVYCEPCDSTGSKSKSKPTCKTCDGRGQVITQTNQGFTILQQVQTCPTCKGSGQMVKPSDKCPACKGKQYKSLQDEVVLEIQPGVEDRKVFKFSKKGNSSLKNKNLVGDLRAVVLVKDHPRFIRVDSNLYMNMKIDYIEALVGFKRTFKHLDGKLYTIEHSRNSHPIVTHSIWTLQNLGMPTVTTKAHLFIKFEVVYPNKSAVSKLSDEEVNLIASKLTPVDKSRVLDSGDEFVSEYIANGGENNNGTTAPSAKKPVVLESSGMREDRKHHAALIKEHKMKEKQEAKRQHRIQSSSDEEEGDVIKINAEPDDDSDAGQDQQQHQAYQQAGGNEMQCQHS